MSDPATVPCVSCGADIPATAKVCGYCGVRQPVPASPEPAPRPVEPGEGEAPPQAAIPPEPASDAAVAPETVPGRAVPATEQGPATAEPVPTDQAGTAGIPKAELPPLGSGTAAPPVMEATPDMVPRAMDAAAEKELAEPVEWSPAASVGIASGGLSRRRLGGWAAMVGGVLMIVSAFLPWLRSPRSGAIWTGWGYVDRLLGIEKLFLWGFYSTGFNPFFTGLAVVIAGGLLVLVGLAMLRSRRARAFASRAAGRAGLVTIALLTLIVGFSSLISCHARGVRPLYGLYLLAAATLVGVLGVAAALFSTAAEEPAAEETRGAEAATSAVPRRPGPRPFGAGEPETAPELRRRSRFLLVVGIIGLVLAAGLAADTLTCGFGLQGWRSSPCRPDMAVFWVFNFAPALAFAALVWQFRVRGTKRERLGALAALAFLGTALCGWAIVRFDPHHDCGSLGQVLDRPSLWLSTTPSPAYGANFCAVEWGRVAGYTLLGLLFLLVLIVLLVVQLVRSRRRRRVV
jgi:hypothetical protein